MRKTLLLLGSVIAGLGLAGCETSGNADSPPVYMAPPVVNPEIPAVCRFKNVPAFPSARVRVARAVKALQKQAATAEQIARAKQGRLTDLSGAYVDAYGVYRVMASRVRLCECFLIRHWGTESEKNATAAQCRQPPTS